MLRVGDINDGPEEFDIDYCQRHSKPIDFSFVLPQGNQTLSCFVVKKTEDKEASDIINIELQVRLNGARCAHFSNNWIGRYNKLEKVGVIDPSCKINFANIN